MGATRQFLATTPHRMTAVAAVLRAFRQIASIASTAFVPTIALPPAARGWMNAVRGARVKALSFLVASALCASSAWSADRVAKSNSAPPEYLPRCNDPAVVNQIGAEFRGRHWTSGFAAVGMHDANEVTRPYWPQEDMPRRFCEGKIELRKLQSGAELPFFYPTYYAVIANGPSYQVEWCAVGLDRMWPLDPRCRLARP
jgi:hypothetical protein